MSMAWSDRLLGRMRRRPEPPLRPLGELCDPIPEEHRARLALDKPEPHPGVTVQGRLGENAVLTLDRRKAAGVSISIIAQAAKEPYRDISLVLGRIDTGRITIVIAGSRVDLVVGSSPRLHCTFGLGADSLVRVGDGTTSSGLEISCQSGRVSVGRNCQSGGGSMIMGAAHHGIVDLSSGRPELVPQRPDVQVGNHVWLGTRCFVGSKAQIGDGCIVAAQASVVAPMPANCLVAGNPARVRRRNVGWSRVPHEIDPGSRAYFEQLDLQPAT